HPLIAGGDPPVRADALSVKHGHAEVASGMLHEALEIERPEPAVAMRLELAAELARRLEPSHTAALRGEQRLDHGGAEASDGSGRFVDVFRDRRRRHRQPGPDELRGHAIAVHRDVEALRGAQHRNTRGLQVTQHADTLLDAPPVGGVAELLDDGAGEPVERLAAMEEPPVWKSQAAGGKIDDSGFRPAGAQ